MKKIISLFLAVAMLVGCTALLAGCKSKDEGAQISVYLGNEVYDFDPTDYYVDSNAEQLMSLLFEPLFYINEKGKLKEAAAEDYTVDEDKRTITIELRESYWSDETRVKAEDFAYAWCNRILDPNNPNPAAALFYDIENAVEVKSGVGSVNDIGVRALSQYVLEITYREGADVDRLLRNLASVAASPVRQSVVDSAPSYWSKTSSGMVFNGPFKIRLIDRDTNELTLERNVGYHQALDERNLTNEVNPHMLVGFVTPAGEQISLSYSDVENKTVFYLADAPLSDRASNKSKAEIYDDTSVYSYVFNTERELFANAKVRRALSVAIDRNAIISAISFGKAANGFIPDAFGGSGKELISSGANVALAEQLLSEVDLTNVDKSFTLTVDNNEESIAIASLVKAAWEALSPGFVVTVEAKNPVTTEIKETEIVDSGIQYLVKEASYGNRQFDVIAVDWQMYTDDAFVGLASMSTGLGGYGADFSNFGMYRTNISGWSNAEYDYLVTAAFKSNGSERRGYLEAAEEYLCNEAPVVPLVFNQSFAFAHKDISKLEADGLGNFVFTDVKLKKYRNYLPKD